MAMEARLPQSKISRIMHILEHFLTLSHCTKQQLLSVTGHLSFASRVVTAGRAFVSRLFALSTTARRLHHFITITQDVREDIHMWLYLLSCWNGVSVFLSDPVSSNDLTLFTDSSSSVGFGAYYKARGQFFLDSWSNHPVPVTKDSMTYLELLPIVAAAVQWSADWAGKKIVFLCDNEGAVAILNKGRSRCEMINKLMRRLTIISCCNNFSFCSQWLSTKANVEADMLSRGLLSSFQKLAPRAVRVPCPTHEEVTFSSGQLPPQPTTDFTPSLRPPASPTRRV